jgi:hypothetical protein
MSERENIKKIEDVVLPSISEIKKAKRDKAKKMRALREVLYILNLIDRKHPEIPIEEALEKINSLIDSEEFDENKIDFTIAKIASDLALTSSTVQRDLSEVLEEIDLRIYTIFRNIMNRKLIERARKGGLAYAEKNRFLKGENGKFIGSVKK